jgi:hypothetical protein
LEEISPISLIDLQFGLMSGHFRIFDNEIASFLIRIDELSSFKQIAAWRLLLAETMKMTDKKKEEILSLVLTFVEETSNDELFAAISPFLFSLRGTVPNVQAFLASPGDQSKNTCLCLSYLDSDLFAKSLLILLNRFNSTEYKATELNLLNDMMGIDDAEISGSKALELKSAQRYLINTDNLYKIIYNLQEWKQSGYGGFWKDEQFLSVVSKLPAKDDQLVMILKALSQ